MYDEELTQALAKFAELSAQTTARLNNFHEQAGDEQFPRAFSDIMLHLAGLTNSSEELKARAVQASVPLIGSSDQLQRSFDGCSRQLQTLLAILDRSLPGRSGGGKKGLAGALKEIYNEKDIPKVQKTLHGYEQSILAIIS